MSTKNDVELDPEVNIELVESITVKSESKFDVKKRKVIAEFHRMVAGLRFDPDGLHDSIVLVHR